MKEGSVFNVLKKVQEEVSAYLFPSFCLGCKKEGYNVCTPCISKIPFYGVFCCPVCRTDTDGGKACYVCKDKTSLDTHIALSTYNEGTLFSDCIHVLKYAYREQIVQDFACKIESFIEQYKKYFDTIECVVPVPLHGRRYAERGYNQAELIARIVAKKLSVPYCDTILKRNIYTNQQAKLSKEKRLKNVSHAFVLQDALRYRRVLLVDDVFTTGSTLGACARVLKENGASYVQGFSLARGEMNN